MYENLIKPVENGQFEEASTSAQWLNLKKKEVAAMASGPNSKKDVEAFPGLRSTKKMPPPVQAPDLKKKRSRRPRPAGRCWFSGDFFIT